MSIFSITILSITILCFILCIPWKCIKILFLDFLDFLRKHFLHSFLTEEATTFSRFSLSNNMYFIYLRINKLYMLLEYYSLEDIINMHGFFRKKRTCWPRMEFYSLYLFLSMLYLSNLFTSLIFVFIIYILFLSFIFQISLHLLYTE